MRLHYPQEAHRSNDFPLLSSLKSLGLQDFHLPHLTFIYRLKQTQTFGFPHI